MKMNKTQHKITIFLISLMPNEIRKIMFSNYYYYIKSQQYENKLLSLNFKGARKKYFNSIPNPPVR